MVEELLNVSGVSKKFGNRKILDNVNLSLNKQEILGITGPSGSGKTVLIKILMGYIKPDKGKVIISPRIGFSVQDNSFYENLTLKQNLNYFAKINNVKDKKETINKLVALLQLNGYENTLVMNLSGGTKKRVDIACALLTQPDVLILDEPYVGLDFSLIKQLSQILLSLKNNGMTIIMSSHVLEPLENICDKLIFIKDAKITQINKQDVRDLY